MRILFLSPRQCWPPLSGAKLREYYLARALGRHAAITHVFFCEMGMPLPGPADLPFCEQLVPVSPPRRYTARKIVLGALGPWPLPLLNYSTGRMRAALADALRRSTFDLVHIDGTQMAAYAGLIRSATAAPIVYDWHNIESEAMRRYSGNATAILRKAYASRTAKQLAAVEARILREGFGHIVCSGREFEQLHAARPRARIAVVENGVDSRRYVPGSAARDRHRIVFVGAMRYHANADAALWFTRSVWPDLRKRFPGWRLTIVGSNPTSAVAALGREPDVEVTGTVPDVQPYYADALAAIVPLRTGGGTRLKILEAMAAGVPVVSTTLGAEGLAVSPGTDILIADKTADWQRRLTELVSCSDVWERIAGAGRELVARRYDWEILGEKLYTTYRQWLASPP